MGEPVKPLRENRIFGGNGNNPGNHFIIKREEKVMKKWFVLLLLAILVGCTTVGRTIQTGMITSEVKAQWGSPWSTFKSYEAGRQIEVWEYGLGQYAVKTWLVFDNGRLVRIVRKGN